MAALFACTKCHSRHPFEELTPTEQLCKSCRTTNEYVRCIYCRVEFQPEDKLGLSPVCKNCSHCLKTHGKPTACEYCKEIAAFVGKKCQRCSHQEKKYGRPQMCERCRNLCAFDRGKEYRSSMEGKLLCWLCIVAYKRANKRQKMELSNQSNAAYSPGSLTPILADKKTSIWSKISDDRTTNSTGSSNGTPNMAKDNHEGDPTRVDNDGLKRKEGDHSSSPKRRKIDKNLSMFLPKKGDIDGDFGGSNEHIIAVTQLRETVESLKKQIQMKDQLIIQKEQKVTELKAQYFEFDKEMRARIQTLQKQHNETVESLQAKVRDLQKRVNVSSKGSKKYVAPVSP